MPSLPSTRYAGLINLTKPDDPQAEDYMVFRAGILPPSENIKVPLYDMRDEVKQSDGSWLPAAQQLDQSGFACSQDPSAFDEEALSTPEGVAGYLEETVNRIRRNDPTPPAVAAEILQYKVEEGFVPKTMPRPIARNAHCDQTYGEDCFEKYSRGQIVNLWRPLVKVTNAPLAVMDYRTLEVDKDVGVHASAFGPLYHFFHNEQQKWYYIPNQTPSDALWIRCFDSKKGTAAYAPHVAVQETWGDEVPPEEQQTRVSIEVRLFLFFE
ncbi:uncharacterized protein IL334_003018 [Kwoniella shivajii]|uniref:Uncharacterized protein n=1 Tax=Kwoniella shivajii TaxID=564305 RepID=A0ABZ1CZD4_9TREE|nr:hypothetical protein IL334_003018 [Kwoniella shivajii]